MIRHLWWPFQETRKFKQRFLSDCCFWSGVSKLGMIFAHELYQPRLFVRMVHTINFSKLNSSVIIRTIMRQSESTKERARSIFSSTHNVVLVLHRPCCFQSPHWSFFHALIKKFYLKKLQCNIPTMKLHYPIKIYFIY